MWRIRKPKYQIVFSTVLESVSQYYQGRHGAVVVCLKFVTCTIPCEPFSVFWFFFSSVARVLASCLYFPTSFHFILEPRKRHRNKTIILYINIKANDMPTLTRWKTQENASQVKDESQGQTTMRTYIWTPSWPRCDLSFFVSGQSLLTDIVIGEVSSTLIFVFTFSFSTFH